MFIQEKTRKCGKHTAADCKQKRLDKLGTNMKKKTKNKKGEMVLPEFASLFIL